MGLSRPHIMTKIAILDDWQGVARGSADWSELASRADLAFFADAFATEDAAAAAKGACFLGPSAPGLTIGDQPRGLTQRGARSTARGVADNDALAGACRELRGREMGAGYANHAEFRQAAQQRLGKGRVLPHPMVYRNGNP